jgi:hypothetical protein
VSHAGQAAASMGRMATFGLLAKAKIKIPFVFSFGLNFKKIIFLFKAPKFMKPILLD